MHAAPREVDAGHRVHVRDDGVDREGVLRRQPCVHRLEREQPLGARVAQELADLRREPPESAESHEAGQIGCDQVERGVDVAVDEVAHLEPVELADEVDVAAIARCFRAAAHALDLGGRRVGVGVDVKRGAVRVERAVERVDGLQVQPVLHPLSNAVERVRDQIGHREHRRAGVEAIPGKLQHPGTSARGGFAFQQRHLPAGAGEP